MSGALVVGRESHAIEFSAIPRVEERVDELSRGKLGDFIVEIDTLTISELTFRFNTNILVSKVKMY